LAWSIFDAPAVVADDTVAASPLRQTVTRLRLPADEEEGDGREVGHRPSRCWAAVSISDRDRIDDEPGAAADTGHLAGEGSRKLGGIAER
jgi:hypothetical protein